MERRSLLKSLGALALLPGLPFTSGNAGKKPVLRVAHLTDVHLKDKWDAPARFARCLHHVQQQPGVDFILNGGIWQSLFHQPAAVGHALLQFYAQRLEVYSAGQRPPGYRWHLVHRQAGRRAIGLAGKRIEQYPCNYACLRAVAYSLAYSNSNGRRSDGC